MHRTIPIAIVSISFFYVLGCNEFDSPAGTTEAEAPAGPGIQEGTHSNADMEVPADATVAASAEEIDMPADEPPPPKSVARSLLRALTSGAAEALDEDSADDQASGNVDTLRQ